MGRLRQSIVLWGRLKPASPQAHEASIPRTAHKTSRAKVHHDHQAVGRKDWYDHDNPCPTRAVRTSSLRMNYVGHVPRWLSVQPAKSSLSSSLPSGATLLPAVTKCAYGIATSEMLFPICQPTTARRPVGRPSILNSTRCENFAIASRTMSRSSLSRFPNGIKAFSSSSTGVAPRSRPGTPHGK